jgi:hypothetical protein
MSRRTVGAVAADAVAVLVFVAVGRRSHDESSVIAGLLGTAWPFLAGLAVGWLVARGWRRPTAAVAAGLPVWLVTVAVGMVLRAATGAGTPPSFVVVASLVLGALLVGWRIVASYAPARRAGSSSSRVSQR